MTGPDTAGLAALGRADWYEIGPGTELHYATLDAEALAELEDQATLVQPITLACGQVVDQLWIPGLGARLETPRCTGCCDVLGYPHGDGSPKNDDACRRLLGLEVSS